MLKNILFRIILALSLLLSVISGLQAQVYPASDQSNSGNWILNTDVSDEFQDSLMNETKWLIQGRNGEYRSNFRGRAPSQFSTQNIRIEDGKLKLTTKWEPDYPFNPTVDKNGVAYENFTTSAVITRKQFLYGYMEIKAKTANVSVQSSFWLTGQNSELDIFENNGNPSLAGKDQLRSEMWSSIHNWGTGGNSVWTKRTQLPFKLAEGEHVYGCEWSDTYVKFYADGNLITTATKEQLGSDWVLTNPMWLWVDNETFPWQGVPSEADLPADYEIEYIRVWQHPKISVTGVTLSPASTSLVVGGTTSLTATVLPADSYDKFLTWSSSNPAIAKVDASGLVTAVASGTVTIKVTTRDGNITDSCSVTVDSSTGILHFNEKRNGEEIRIYPNPYSNGELSIEFSETAEKLLEMFDLHGKVVFSDFCSGQTEMKINPAQIGLQPGIYFVRVQNPTKSIVKKIIIEK